MTQRSPAAPATPLGVILAGGASRRFGSPKALAPVDGRRMVDRVLDALAAAVPEVVVSANDSALFADLGLPVIPDAKPGMGPLGGIHAALLQAAERGRPGVLVAAADMPYVTPALLRLVARRAAASTADAVVPESDGRRGMEPLCAFYSTACLATVERMLAEGELRAHRLPARVRTERIPLDQVAALGDPRILFHNVNTVDDLHVTGPDPSPPVVSIIGRKNAGKTTLMVDLLRELRRRGHRVASLKHGHHAFETDEPGRDTWRHFNEGHAEATIMAGEGKVALVMRVEGQPDPRGLVRDFFSGHGYDLVLVEGYKQGPFPRIEIWRGGHHVRPLYEELDEAAGPYLAIVSDNAGYRSDVPVVLLDSGHPPSHVDRLVGMLESVMAEHARHAG